MAADAQDRRLPASQRKIEKARAEGQVARSRDLGHLTALGGGMALLLLLAPQISGWLSELLTEGLRFDAATLAHPGAMLDRFSVSGTRLLLLVLPFGALIALAAVASGVLAGGWNFTWSALAPHWERFDPIAGAMRLVSRQQLADTLKVCLLALVLGAIGAWHLHAHLAGYAELLAMPLPAALAATGSLLRSGVLLLLLALLVFALVDVPLQRRMLMNRLRMSVDEVKKEHKEVEGNTEVKGRIRARMREVANRRMLAAVPRADLVVMNPTHYAVALRYDDTRMAAPRVVAKGADLMALRIRDAAREHKVPVLQAAPLARALYKHAEIDAEIPAALFSAVAQVLAWVFQLRAAAAAGRHLTLAAPDVQLAPGLDPGAAE